jgi:hypothetical protein
VRSRPAPGGVPSPRSRCAAIEVKAKRANRLQETNLKNNVSLRKVVLGGTPGARTVTVPPYDLINAP